MRNPKEHEKEYDSYARGPFSILIMGILVFWYIFWYICAGMRLCRVGQQFYFLCSKSKPELVILCLGLSIDLGEGSQEHEISSQTNAVKKADYLTYAFKLTPLNYKLIIFCHYRCFLRVV